MEKGARSRMLKVAFDPLDRNQGCVLPDCRLPPVEHLDQIGPKMESLLSVIGPDLIRFESCPRRVNDFARFLATLIGRPPGQREESLAAYTADMTCQVVHTYTQLPLQRFVEYFALKWVPQQRLLFADTAARDDTTGSFLCDAHLCRSVDPMTNANFLFANTYRTHFFPNESVILRGNQFHVFRLQQLIDLILRQTHRLHDRTQIKEDFYTLFEKTMGTPHLHRLRVRMLDYGKGCLSDLIRNNNGQLPHESQLEGNLSNEAVDVIAVPASFVHEKIGHIDAAVEPERDHSATIAAFIRKIETRGYYPEARPAMPWSLTLDDVDDIVARHGHTRAIGLATADFAPLPSAFENDITEENIAEMLNADDELLDDSELEEEDDDFDCSAPATPPRNTNLADVHVLETPPSSGRAAKRVCSQPSPSPKKPSSSPKKPSPSPKEPSPSPSSPNITRRRQRRIWPIESQSQESVTFSDLSDVVPDVAENPGLDGDVLFPSADQLAAANPGIDAAHFSPALRPPTPTQPPSSPRFPEHISSQPFDRGV
jgi:hypothetical protein